MNTVNPTRICDTICHELRMPFYFLKREKASRRCGWPNHGCSEQATLPLGAKAPTSIISILRIHALKSAANFFFLFARSEEERLRNPLSVSEDAAY